MSLRKGIGFCQQSGKSRNKTALFVYLNALLNLSKGDSACPDFNSS